MAPEPRKQHCYEGVGKHWTQLRKEVLKRQKEAVLHRHLRDEQEAVWSGALGFTGVEC